MKKCNSCKEEKILEDFASDKTTKDGLSGRCKECQREYGRKHYNNNKDYYKKKMLKIRKETSIFLRYIKESIGCASCDENRGVCLDFHHEYPEDKSFDISISCGYSKEKIVEEIKKCIIVCANCHRIIHKKYEY